MNRNALVCLLRKVRTRLEAAAEPFGEEIELAGYCGRAAVMVHRLLRKRDDAPSALRFAEKGINVHAYGVTVLDGRQVVIDVTATQFTPLRGAPLSFRPTVVTAIPESEASRFWWWQGRPATEAEVTAAFAECVLRKRVSLDATRGPDAR